MGLLISSTRFGGEIDLTVRNDESEFLYNLGQDRFGRLILYTYLSTLGDVTEFRNDLPQEILDILDGNG